MSKSRTIIVLGSLGLVVVLLASWFLLLSPRMSRASDLNEQRASVETQNDATLIAVKDLQQQEANIDQAKAEADALSSRFPATADQSTMFALLQQAARQAGLSPSAISDLTVGVPAIGATDGSVTLPAPAASPAADPNAAPGASSDPAAAAAAPPAAAPAAGQLGSMTVDMTVTGSQKKVILFLRALENMNRAFLVNSVTMGAAEGGAGTASISGTMYLLPELTEPTDPAATPPPGTPTTPVPGQPTSSPTGPPTEAP